MKNNARNTFGANDAVFSCGLSITEHDSFLFDDAVILHTAESVRSIVDLFQPDKMQDADYLLTDIKLTINTQDEHNCLSLTNGQSVDGNIGAQISSEEPCVDGVSNMPDEGKKKDANVQAEFEAKAMAIVRTIGQDIRSARRRTGLNQDQYAEKIGMSRRTLSKIESGAVTEVDMVIRAAVGLNVPILCARRK